MAQGPIEKLRDFPFSSVILDTLVRQRVSQFPGNYEPIEPGTPFNSNSNTNSVADITAYGGTISLGQRATGDDNEWMERFWATLPHTQDVYNYKVGRDQEAGGFPVFTRRYLELRDDYPSLQRTPLTPFTGLYAITITNAGSGYDPAHPPAVTCNNGATAIAVVNPADGSIAKITLKAEGANCTSVVTIAAPPVGGTQATATGVLQPDSCVLIKEDAVPAPIPWDSLYLLVERTYKILPGPVVTSVKIYGNTGMPMLVSRQEIATPTMPNYQAGEFKPAAINVQSIGTGSTPTVALASDIGLAAGAWVTFVGTTTTPSMTTAPLQIVSVGTNSIQVSVPSPITAGQAGAGGTVQSTNYVTREFEETPNANIKIKVDTTLFIPDPSVYNQVAKGDEQYPFPGYLRSIVFYRSKALTAVSPASPSPSSSFSYGGQPLFDIQPGYRGPCPAYILTFFFSGPPPDSFAALYPPTIIIPASGTDAVQGGSVATKGLPTLFDMISISGQWTGHFTGEFLTGPTPNNYTTIDPSANAMAVNSISSGDASGTPNYPVVEVNVNHGLTAGMFIELDGTAYDGTYQILGVPALNQVTIAQTTTSQGPGGTMSLTANTQFGSQEASLEINLAVSTPPKIVGILNLVSISGGSTPTVTANSAHYLKSGNWVLLATTNTSPSVDGRWQITVTGSTTFTITPPSSITGSTGHGTMQNIITVVGKPQKLTVANLWQVDVVQILVPYTSGEYP